MALSADEQARIDAILAAPAHPAVAFADPEAPSHAAPAPTLDELIAAARQKLLGQTSEQTVDKKIEAPDRNVFSQMLAEADEHQRLEKFHAAERAKISDFFADYIIASESATGKLVDELTVDGATVFTYKTVTSRVLDQPHIKSLFPDLPENAEMWTELSSRRKLYK